MLAYTGLLLFYKTYIPFFGRFQLNFNYEKNDYIDGNCTALIRAGYG